MSNSLSLKEYTRSLIGIILFALLLCISIPFIFIILLLSFGKATDFVIRTFAPGIAKPVLATIGIKFSVLQHGEPTHEPAVVIINHSSTLDILTMMALGLDKIRFVAKWELQYFPFFFIVGRLTGQVFIKRKKREEAIKTLVDTYKRLKKQKLSVMVAPEGSRKHDGIIGPFKKGAFRMAMDLEYPILPIYFEGNNQLSLGGSIFSKSGNIIAHLHPFVPTEDWSLETIEDHIQDVRNLYLNWAGVNEHPL